MGVYSWAPVRLAPHVSCNHASRTWHQHVQLAYSRECYALYIHRIEDRQVLRRYKGILYADAPLCANSNRLKDGQRNSGPTSTTLPHHASWCCYPYIVVEPGCRLDLGMAPILYVHPTTGPFHHVNHSVVYKHWASEVVSFVPFLLGRPVIYTSSLEVMRQTVAGGYQSVWVKPKWATKVLE